ncbi:MAG: hypothetical protein MH472_03835 [Bacteroidia bacterium]|nr:hypothetical protein [Bacteroidia bacterium]
MPFLFNDEVDDDYKVDQGYEAMMDFFMSWTIRFSQDKYKESNPKVNFYARKILWALLYGIDSKFDPSFKVNVINTYRQWNRIDLNFEIEFTLNDKNESFSLYIEDKWYSKLGKDQLAYYSNLLNSFYKGSLSNVRKILLLADDRGGNIEEEYEACKSFGFELFTLSDLFEYAEIKPTGNDIFDEFWIYSEATYMKNYQHPSN